MKNNEFVSARVGLENWKYKTIFRDISDNRMRNEEVKVVFEYVDAYDNLISSHVFFEGDYYDVWKGNYLDVLDSIQLFDVYKIEDSFIGLKTYYVKFIKGVS